MGEIENKKEIAEKLCCEGYKYKAEGKWEQAEEVFNKAIELGDAQAMFDLGTMYRDGFPQGDHAYAEMTSIFSRRYTGVPRNYRKTLDLYRRAYTANKNIHGQLVQNLGPPSHSSPYESLSGLLFSEYCHFYDEVQRLQAENQTLRQENEDLHLQLLYQPASGDGFKEAQKHFQSLQSL